MRANTCIRLVLPLPPSVNNWVVPIARGRAVLSREARAYKQAAVAELRRAGLKPFAGDVLFRADVFRPRRAGDLSNYIKILEDVLRGFAYGDDKQTVELHLRRWEDSDTPRVQLEVEEVLARWKPELWEIPPSWFQSFKRIQAATEEAHAKAVRNQKVKRQYQAPGIVKVSLKSLARSAVVRGAR